MTSSALNAKKLIALSLCLSFLLTGGAWVVSDTNDTGNVATETDLSWEARFGGTRGDPILIRNVWDLQNMSNDLTAHYALANDIDASATKDWNDGAGFEPVGKDPQNPFTGSLDGRNFTISGLYIDRSSKDFISLFGFVEIGGSVINVSMENVDITGRDMVGGLVGYNKGSVSNCNAMGSVSGKIRVGGLMGYIWQGSVSRCYAMGSVSGGDYVGGLIGATFDCSVSKCYATASVNGGDYIGGLVGNNGGSSSVSDSYATGNVNATGSVVGGLVGMNVASVSNSYAKGRVTRLSGTNTDFGGFVGYNFRSRINNCYSTGSVYYTGNPDPTDKGFCGKVDTGGSYEMTGNFWDTETSGQTSTAGRATGKTTAEMKTKITFTDTGWDYDDVWWLIETISYPLLMWRFVIIAVADVDQTVDEGAEVIFDGSTSASLDDGGIVNYIWTFHDGTEDVNLNGVNPKHTFTVPGIYVVTLNVTDATGNWDTDTMTVTVNDITPPVANAGPDQTADEGVKVSFDGTASRDNVGIVNYTWTFYDGTENITLYGVAPVHIFTVPGIYLGTLTVADAAGLTDTDTMTVTVKDITPPVANAGPDQTVDEGTQVTFNGTASTDNVGIVNYTWTFHDGKRNVTLDGVAPGHIFTVPGNYTVTLTVADAAGFTDTDTMTVFVNDITPPTANAGPDQTVDEGTQVTFDGTASTDNVGIVNYTWTFHDGIGDMILYGVAPSHTFTVPGIYVVMLNVTDAVSFTDTDTMTVTVNDTIPPTAHAGPDQTVDEGAQVTFNGSGSTDNVGIVNYAWTFHDGTGEITLYGAAPGHTFTVPGTYTVTLTVADAAGNNDTDTMVVTVNDITPPTAHAGPDQTVDKGARVTFDGSAGTDNVGIVNYTWTFHDGTGNVTLSGITPSHTFTVPGTYTVTLTVADATGLTDTDTMVVSVSSSDEGQIERHTDFILDYWPMILILIVVLAAAVLLGVRGKRKAGGPPGSRPPGNPSGQTAGQTAEQAAVQMAGQTTGQRPPETQFIPDYGFAPAPSSAPPPAGPSYASAPPAQPATPPSYAPVTHTPFSPGAWVCPNCGKNIEGQYVFCLGCGFRRSG